MSEVIIKVENLSKCYRIKHQTDRQSYTTLRDTIAGKFRGWIRSRHTSTAPCHSTEDFWALKDVSFEVKQGEVVGIIGRNGAGKSTLLKILSRITEPTKGQVTLRGRVASLLEVGTGFHPELTGRENIFLNGAILGMSRAEIRKKFDEIVAFAEVEKFLDTPVKRYSSGMYVRLAFAVAAHLEPEILIVDEVLAVGDTEFQKKCLGKMESVSRKEGRTVLFVSHNMPVVSRICQRAILLDRGSVSAEGKTAETLARYLETHANAKSQFIPACSGRPKAEMAVSLLKIVVQNQDGGTGPNFVTSDKLNVEIYYRVAKPTTGLRVGFHLHAADGTIVFNTADTDTLGATNRDERPGDYLSECKIPNNLLNRGQYSITVGADTPEALMFYWENALTFFLVPNNGLEKHGDNRPGLVRPDLEWQISSMLEQKFNVGVG